MWSEIWKCVFFSVNNKDFQSSNVSSGWLSFKQPIMWKENNDNTKLQLQENGIKMHNSSLKKWENVIVIKGTFIPWTNNKMQKIKTFRN